MHIINMITVFVVVALVGVRSVLLAAVAIWVLASLASIIFLIPMNTRIAQRDADWQRISHIWDKRHRARVAALALSAVLLMYAIVR